MGHLIHAAGGHLVHNVANGHLVHEGVGTGDILLTWTGNVSDADTTVFVSPKTLVWSAVDSEWNLGWTPAGFTFPVLISIRIGGGGVYQVLFNGAVGLDTWYRYDADQAVTPIDDYDVFVAKKTTVSVWEAALGTAPLTNSIANVQAAWA